MNDELEELESSLSDKERELVHRLEESYLEELEGDNNAEPKARKAALLGIKSDRESAASLEKWFEARENPQEADTDELVAVEERNIEASREEREYLEEIGVYPMTPDGE